MTFEIIGLLIVLLLVLALPFIFKKIEHNLEIFLFIMGVVAVIISGELKLHLLQEIITNKFLYIITGAVLIAGFIFKYTNEHIRTFMNFIEIKLPLKIIIFLVVVILGFLSSVITAIITALILVEIVQGLGLNHKAKIHLTIIGCFSIGLGAILTPAGEPIATIVTSKMKGDFGYLFSLLNWWIVLGIIGFGIFGAFYINHLKKKEIEEPREETQIAIDIVELEDESNKDIIIRAGKIFLFVVALELLGSGFKPLIDTYVIGLDNKILFWVNMTSAILDNATLAAAEISSSMQAMQVKTILLGLLISGGMLIPGNIPNIICAGKLKIKSKDWAKFGVPVGLVTLVVYFIALFIIKL